MMHPPDSTQAERAPNNIWQSGLGWAAVVALLRLLLYVWIGPRYGYFRDELYYLACGHHPAWGYVDQPPMIAWMAWLLEHSIGTSLYALRLLPALAGAGTIFLCGWLAKEFGGGRRAVLVAALAALCTPIYLAMSHLFSMNAFDPLLWMAAAAVLVRAAKTGNENVWIWLGPVVGFALLNKYGVAFFTLGLLAGILLTPMRSAFLNLRLWAGAAIGAAIAMPNFLWQWHRGFPFLQLMHAIRASGRDTWNGVPWFLGQQAQILHPLNVVLIAGALIFWFGPRGKAFRSLGWAFLATFLLLMAMHAKNYYLAPMYPMVLAGGAVWLGSVRYRWIVPAFSAVLIASGILLSPIAVPVLTVNQYLRYTHALGIAPPKFENNRPGLLPQLYADMFGWEPMAQKVAAYYNSLPDEERARTGIFANNYGEAGAIDFFGPRYGLPPAISGHQNYWYWGAHGYTGESLIVLGDNEATLKKECSSVTTAAVLDDKYARRDEIGSVFHCRGLKWNLADDWARVKKWN
ncbi:MAG TPA: glycosyltransferase family 39 protein [Acidisarcina sp.]|nr:glycosyltransferase family 39 protein [Acidisarcina sp.]